MGSARDFVRVEYSRDKDLKAAREAFAAKLAKTEFEGAYYRVVDDVRVEPDGKVRLKAVSVTGALEVGTITFDLQKGGSTIDWHNSDPDED